MNCDETKKFLHAYLDKQLDTVNSVSVEQHLKGCAACDEEYLELVELQTLVNTNLKPYSAPDNLHAKILSNLTSEATTAHVIDNPKSSVWKYGFSFAASLVIGFALVFNFIDHHNEEKLIDDMLAGHIRAITAKRYTDIQSSKIETIIPWFTSKLDYSPKIFNFSGQGFKLIGGRLDSFQNQNIAAVSYQIDHSLINVYTWPSPEIDDAVQESHNKQGYHLVYWCKNNMNYWIVSDGDNKHIIQLATLIQDNLKK